MTDDYKGVPTPKRATARRAMLSSKEVFAALDKEWNFDILLEPYLEGGSKDHPVTRSWGTVIDWLINKRKFPPDVVGAGIFLTWLEIKKNGDFRGDGTYGSPGDEFVNYIRQVCASIMKQRATQQIFSGMAGKVGQQIQATSMMNLWDSMPWWLKLFSWKYKKYKKQQKELKARNAPR